MHTGCQAVVCKHHALQAEGMQMCPCVIVIKLVARPRPAGQAYVPSLYTRTLQYIYTMKHPIGDDRSMPMPHLL